MVKGGLVMVKPGSAGSLPAGGYGRGLAPPNPCLGQASRLRSQGRTGLPSESFERYWGQAPRKLHLRVLGTA
jgi:hypothetical protein